jgi:hypothetical protein
MERFDKVLKKKKKKKDGKSKRTGEMKKGRREKGEDLRDC